MNLFNNLDVAAREPLRSWQQQALVLWLKHRRGIISVATGAGKTRFAHECMRSHLTDQSDSPVLIVVPSIALLDQWVVALRSIFLLSDQMLSVFGGGTRPRDFARINVAVDKTVTRLDLRKLPRSTLLIADECHRLATPKNRDWLRHPFSSSLGLSATPERQYDTGLDDILIPAFGPVIFEYSLSDALRDQILCPLTMVNIRFNLLEDEQTEYDKMTKVIRRLSVMKDESEDASSRLKMALLKRSRLCANSPRRSMITGSIMKNHSDQQVMIFHESIGSASHTEQILRQIGVSVATYHTKLGPTMRWDNLRQFRSHRTRALISCRALDEGIDIPSASVAIIASSSASVRQRIQRLGRVLRPAPGKTKATVYTLYASAAEERRLLSESQSLDPLDKNTTWMITDISRASQQ